MKRGSSGFTRRGEGLFRKWPHVRRRIIILLAVRLAIILIVMPCRFQASYLTNDRLDRLKCTRGEM